MSCLQRDNYVPCNFHQSRRVQKPRERTRRRSGSRAGRPPTPLGARPGLESNQDSLSGLSSTDLKDESKPCNQCRFHPTAQIHLKGLYNQGLSTPGERREEKKSLFRGSHQKLGFRASLPHRTRISYSLILQV